MVESNANTTQQALRHRLRELGFDEVRFAAVGDWREQARRLSVPSDSPGPARTLREWLAGGMHADMQWMERSADKRANPELVLPGARSAILLGVNYWSGAAGPLDQRPHWARYALNEDYHDTMKPALVEAGRIIEAMYGVGDGDYRYYVDTGPVVERAWSAQAGLGFIGKNAMLISRDHGNWLFLAAILTRIDFVPDAPIRKRLGNVESAYSEKPGVGLLCGKCTRCLEACPTDAFAAPGVVDARRCISYQTIENKGVIPRKLRAGIGLRIYGCDVCLEVCPWNRFAREGRRLLLSARYDIADLPLRDILAMTPERFAEVFRRTPIKRLKLGGLLRNACIVAGNTGDRSLLPVLVSLAEGHPLALVRAHAVWAVQRLGGSALLEGARNRECDAVVVAEYEEERTEGLKG